MYKLFVLLFISTHKADRLILEVTVFLHCSAVNDVCDVKK